MTETSNERLSCGCPSTFPDWHKKDVNLAGHLVHGQKQSMFMHMPIGHEAKLDLQFKDMQRLDLHARWPGFVLSRSAMFRGQLLCLLSEEHSPARSVFCLPRPFNLRVALFHGDVADVRLSVAKMQSALLDEGKMPKSLFLAYLTCPRCQDERGGMQVMLLRQWIANEKLYQKAKKAST
ncbi:MAG: hypothetical protein Q9M22_04120 [Mariprofundaceae bacterium]|nr:hypothetical protein [Mariprofundaceae bacterium]